MKKILILLAFVSVTAYGQIDTVNIGTTGGSGTGDPLRTAFIKINKGLKILDSLQMYNLTSSEMGILSGGTITTTELNYLSGVTSAVQTQINGKLSISDTASMLSPYALSSEIVVATGINAGDTASMLLPYVRESEVLALGYMALTDTAAMLLPYIREAQVLAYGYVASSDTAAMLLPYIRAAEVASGYDATGTASGLVSTHESTYNHSNFATAYSWGNHASAGYVTGTPWTAVGYLTSVDISDINTTGTASSSTYLRGDGAWTAISGGTSTITDLGGTAWRVFYSNGSGEVTELALGADGTYLRSNGASAAPTFATPSGTGDMLQSVYDTDENNVVDEAETAATVTGLSLGAGNLALVGDFSLTHTLFGNTGIRWPSSTNDSVAYRSWVRDYFDALLADGELGIAAADSGVYDGGYVTPTGLDAAIAAVETGAVDSSLYVTVTRLTDSLNVIRTQISSLITTINNAGLLVTSINVASLSGAVIIDSDGGSLDFEADVEPNTALDTTLTWSYIAGTGTATFETEDGAPTLTALTDGTVTVRATANDGSGIYGEVQITISNQVGPIAMSTAELGTYNDSIIATTWDRNLHQDSVPPISAFSVTEDGNTFGIEAITINEDSLFIALDSTGAYGSTYLLSYTPGTPAVQDSSENNAVSFTGQAVTNNISEPAAPGSNFISNGTFDSATDWSTPSDYWTISGGVATFNQTSSGLIAQASGDMLTAIVADTRYLATYDVTLGTATTASFDISNAAHNVEYVTATSHTENGNYRRRFKTPADISAGGICFRASSSSSDGTFSLDNVTLELNLTLLTDGTFDSAMDVYWSTAGNWTISGGAAIFDDVASNYIYQEEADMAAAIEESTEYAIILTIDGLTGTAPITISNSDYSVVYMAAYTYSNGTTERTFTTPADIGVGGVAIRASGTSGSSFSITEAIIVRN